MAETAYEGMFILDSNAYARDPSGTASSVTDLLEKQGGELLVSRLWSEQKLAYPIEGHRKGTYWLTYFRMESRRLSALNEALRLNGNVVRSLILRLDDRLVDAMVAHARGEKPESAEGGEGEKTESPAEKAPAAAV